MKQELSAKLIQKAVYQNVRKIDLGYCLSIGIARTIDLEGGLLIGIVRKIDLGYCLLIGIAQKIDLEGGLLIGIVRTIDLGYCLLITTARTIDLEGRLLLELSGQLIWDTVY